LRATTKKVNFFLGGGKKSAPQTKSWLRAYVYTYVYLSSIQHKIITGKQITNYKIMFKLQTRLQSNIQTTNYLQTSSRCTGKNYQPNNENYCEPHSTKNRIYYTYTYRYVHGKCIAYYSTTEQILLQC